MHSIMVSQQEVPLIPAHWKVWMHMDQRERTPSLGQGKLRVSRDSDFFGIWLSPWIPTPHSTDANTSQLNSKAVNCTWEILILRWLGDELASWCFWKIGYKSSVFIHQNLVWETQNHVRISWRRLQLDLTNVPSFPGSELMLHPTRFTPKLLFLLMKCDFFFRGYSHTESKASTLRLGFMLEKVYEAHDILKKDRVSAALIGKPHHSEEREVARSWVWRKTHLATQPSTSPLKKKLMLRETGEKGVATLIKWESEVAPEAPK